MNAKVRLIAVVVIFVATGIYVKFVSEPARKKATADLQSATTNEVIAALGRPFKIVEATNFTSRANEIAEEGFPISKADVSARGMVWLYPDGGIKNTDMRNYQTVFFDESNQVYRVFRTYWAKDPWGAKL